MWSDKSGNWFKKKTTDSVFMWERDNFYIFVSAMKYIWQVSADSNFSAPHSSPNFIILGCILVTVAHAEGEGVRSSVFTSKVSP